MSEIIEFYWKDTPPEIMIEAEVTVLCFHQKKEYHEGVLYIPEEKIIEDVDLDVVKMRIGETGDYTEIENLNGINEREIRDRAVEIIKKMQKDK